MTLAHQVIRVLLLTTLMVSTASAQLVPPPQDFYLQLSQQPDGASGLDDYAYVDTPGTLITGNTLTVEAWVFWEGSDFEEIQTATGTDMDFMTLLCGQ